MKFVVKPGNNSRLITKVFEESGRMAGQEEFPGWELVDEFQDSIYNFKWKPTSGGINFDTISKHGIKQLVNHVKGHGCLTMKDKILINLKAYYES